jgi:hypothetical protein
MFAGNVVCLKPNTLNAFNHTFEKKVVPMRVKITICTLLLLLCSLSTLAATVQSDCLTIFQFGAVQSQTCVSEAAETAGQLYSVNVGSGVLNLSQFGHATELLEPDGSISDIFGIYADAASFHFGFASDTENLSAFTAAFGTPTIFLPEGNGVFDATQYLDPTVASSNGLSAQFVSDADPAATPEPSSLLLLGSGLFGLAAVVRRKLLG